MRFHQRLFSIIILLALIILFIYLNMSQSHIRESSAYEQEDVTTRSIQFNVPLNENIKQSSSTTRSSPEKRPKNRVPKRNSTQTNIAYISIPRTGDEILASMFRRFGFARNLSFVLPVQDKMFLAWPYLMTGKDFRPSLNNGTFNILCERAVYDELLFSQLLPEDTTYVVSVREPLHHLVSLLFHFDMFYAIEILPEEDPITVCLENIELLRDLYQASDVRSKCIPDNFVVTRNLLSFSLGFPTGFAPDSDRDMSTDMDFIIRWLNMVPNKFETVFTEFFDESLVLLKRRLFWSIADILYWRPEFEDDYRYDRQNLSPGSFEKLLIWSSVDIALYRHLNQTFWSRVKLQGNDFWGEVLLFKEHLRDVNRYCSAPRKPSNELIFPESKWSPSFQITRRDCTLMEGNELLDKLKKNYDRKFPPTRQQHASLRTYC